MALAGSLSQELPSILTALSALLVLSAADWGERLGGAQAALKVAFEGLAHEVTSARGDSPRIRWQRGHECAGRG